MPRHKLPDKDFKWTPNLAYILGLLVTDGNLSKDGRHITMRSSDKELLETFKQCLSITNAIGRTFNNGRASRPSYRVQFGNIQFYNWLIGIGIKPAKTYTIGKIKIPDNLFRDFLRGHLDGDGNVSAYIDRRVNYRGHNYANQRIFTRFISASHKHLVWLQSQIKKLAGMNGAFICNKQRIENHVSMWELKFAKTESLKLLHWIYYDPSLPCLERKRELALKTMATISAYKRKEYTKIPTRGSIY